MRLWGRKKVVPLGGRPAESQLGGQSGRVNPWPKCRGRNCWHRVPLSVIHAYCRRACHSLGPLPLTHLGGATCCPGFCRTCNICWDRGHSYCPNGSHCILACPGICEECGNCLDQCPGHPKGKGE